MPQVKVWRISRLFLNFCGLGFQNNNHFSHRITQPGIDFWNRFCLLRSLYHKWYNPHGFLFWNWFLKSLTLGRNSCYLLGTAPHWWANPLRFIEIPADNCLLLRWDGTGLEKSNAYFQRPKVVLEVYFRFCEVVWLLKSSRFQNWNSLKLMAKTESWFPKALHLLSNLPSNRIQQGVFKTGEFSFVCKHCW